MTESDFIFICPVCGKKFLFVSSGIVAGSFCPECGSKIPATVLLKNSAVLAKDKLREIQRHTELQEAFCEAIKKESFADDKPERVGRDIATSLLSNDAYSLLMAVTGWSIQSLFDFVKPVAIDEEPSNNTEMR